MPRSSGGTYTLYTPGNPVVTNTVISSTWANNTLTDLATAMTDSLSRTGQGGMSAPLQLANGTLANPGLTWGTETTAGLYRAGAGDFRFAIGGTDAFRFGGSTGTTSYFGNGAVATPSISFVSETNSGIYRAAAADFRFALAGVDALQLTTNLLQMSGTAPVYRWNESDAAANNKLWDIVASGEDLNFRALTDALAATNFMTVSRTAGVVDTITMASTTLSVSGSLLSTAAGTGVAPNISMAVAGTPILAWKQTTGAVDNKNWFMNVSSEQFNGYIGNDANVVFTNWLEVNRTGTTVDTVNFPNGTLQYEGIEVGYRGFRQRRNFSGNDNTAATDAGGVLVYTGAGGHTLTLDADPAQQCLITILNAGTGNLTIATAGVIAWFNGSGSIPTGSRTLAVSGYITAYQGSANGWNVTGTGLS